MVNSPQPLDVDQPTRALYDGYVPPPKFATLHTTRFCNLRCPMCEFARNGTVVTGPHMEPELVDKFSGEVLPILDRIHLTVSGEPLMTKNLPHLLEKAAQFGVRVDLLTNGMLLNERMARLLLPAVAHLAISFDAPDKETLEAIRVGGDFDRILANMRRFCELSRELPESQRPITGMRCTLMERNIRKAPQMVDLAVDLGIDLLSFHHLHAFEGDMKSQCLVHHQELAVECIDRVMARAKELGQAVQVDALGTIAAETALAVDQHRAIPVHSGVISGLEQRSVNTDLMRDPPGRDPADPDFAAIERLRREARADQKYPPPPEPVKERAASSPGELPESIWICDQLLTRTHVGLTGEVRPCCVPGNPVLGDLRHNSFDEIWNGPAYRAMRTRLIAKDPVPVCQGCQYIRKVRDPKVIEQFLGGKSCPDSEELPDCATVTLGANRDLGDTRLIQCVDAPVLQWQPQGKDCRYEIELSLDGFAKIAFCSTWHQGLLGSARYEIPDWAWQEAPQGQIFAWRAIAYVDGSRVEAAIGRLCRDPRP